jgi:RNA polymerase sigma-70 factor (ECF subfamily)
METPLSLLERLRHAPDAAAWQALVDLYTPLIQSWFRRQALPPADADDLTQDVLAVVVRELPHFQHNLRRGAFRRWLRTIVVNVGRNYWRGRGARPVAAGGSDAEKMLEQLEAPNGDLNRLWDEEHDRHVLRRLLELIEADFEPATWQAFRALVLDGRPAPEVAVALGISVNAARIAKSRVLSRLRQESEGLVD